MFSRVVRYIHSRINPWCHCCDHNAEIKSIEYEMTRSETSKEKLRKWFASLGFLPRPRGGKSTFQTPWEAENNASKQQWFRNYLGRGRNKGDKAASDVSVEDDPYCELFFCG